MDTQNKTNNESISTPNVDNNNAPLNPSTLTASQLPGKHER